MTPRRGDGDSADRDRLEALLGSPCPVLVVDVDRCGGVPCGAECRTRQIARIRAGEKQTRRLAAFLDGGRSEIVDEGKKAIVRAGANVECGVTRQFTNSPIRELPEHIL